MIVTIHLVDTLETTKVGTCRADIITRVTTLYTDCFNFANQSKPKDGPHSFTVNFAAKKPTPTNFDLIIYFLPATFYSIIQYDSKKIKANNLLSDHWGLTVVNPAKNPVPSDSKTEIACKNNDGAVLGSLVVHEILHAKTGKDNKTLHATGGLGSAVVAAGTTLNNTNRTDIATTISKPVTQWLGGWDIMEAAKKARDSGDPAWDLF